MKALHCSALGGCNAIKSFNLDTSITTCDCGKVTGWWLDPVVGTCVLYCPDPADKPLGHVIVFHNGVLNDGPNMIPKTYFDPLTQHQIPYPATQADTFWRQIHLQSGFAPKAPETVRIFDASTRACWVVILEPGTTADNSWASEGDYKQKLKVPILST